MTKMKRMTGMTNETPIKVNDFVTIVSAKKMKGSGLNNGDILMIAALKVAPASKKDLYLQRIYAVGMKMVNQILQVPSDTNEFQAYLIDPRNVQKLSEEDQKVHTGYLVAQFDEAAENAASN